MRKFAGLALLGLAWGMAFQSCIFQTDPARPNSPPYIKDYFPTELVIEIEAPIDSVCFSFRAEDPDRDELKYSYVLLDNDGEIDSFLHNGSEFVFDPEKGGFYHVQARAMDFSEYVARDWYVKAFELHNDPPEIVWRSPDQDSLTTLIGSTVYFRMGVEDDHPDDLRYSYYIDSTPIEFMDPTSDVEYRFMENGNFKITGRVFDGEFSDYITWAVRVVGEPDTIPPSRIDDLIGWTGVDPGTIRIRWTAPGDDGDEGRASYYRIRTHTKPILTEDDWDEASQKNNVPVPGPAGTVEEMIVNNLNPGTWLFVTARAIDDFGNISDLGNTIRLLVRGVDATGFVTDAETGLPIEGVVISAEGIMDTTGTDGYYNLVNIPLFTGMIRLRDEHDPEAIGDYFDVAWPLSGIEWHFTMDFQMIPNKELVSALASWYADYYVFMRYLTMTKESMGWSTIYQQWNHYPVTVYNPPYTVEGVEVRDLARAGMNGWNDGTGKSLFVETEDSEAADVEIIYVPESSVADHQVELISTNPDGTPTKMVIWIYPNNRKAPIEIAGKKIFAHEFGHILQLGHSSDLGHLMVGMTSPIIDEPSEDEINLIGAMVGMPPVFDMDWHLQE